MRMMAASRETMAQIVWRNVCEILKEDFPGERTRKQNSWMTWTQDACARIVASTHGSGCLEWMLVRLDQVSACDEPNPEE